MHGQLVVGSKNALLHAQYRVGGGGIVDGDGGTNRWKDGYATETAEI
jgi:hypothetical protein